MTGVHVKQDMVHYLKHTYKKTALCVVVMAYLHRNFDAVLYSTKSIQNEISKFPNLFFHRIP